MNNSNSTDTNKTASPQTPPVTKVENPSDGKTAKVEDPKPSPETDTDRKASGDQKQTTDDSAGKSLR
jgi:hypothetical protein